VENDYGFVTVVAIERKLRCICCVSILSSSVEVGDVPLRILYVLNDLLTPLDIMRKRSFVVVVLVVVVIVVVTVLILLYNKLIIRKMQWLELHSYQRSVKAKFHYAS